MTDEELFKFAERKTVEHILGALQACVEVSEPGPAHTLRLFGLAVQEQYKLPTIQ